ncbi:MAG: hypothetical protein WBL62_10275 [Gallionella sp.]
MKQQKTSGVSKLVASLLGAALLGLATQNAMALTAAGTTVSNIATLQYAVGGVAQNSISSSSAAGGNSTQNGSPTAVGVSGAGGVLASSFLVDYKVDLSVTGGTTVNVTPGQVAATNVTGTLGAYTTFTVQNNSNAIQSFSLVAADAANGAIVSPAVMDAFNTASNTIYVDTNGNLVLDAADTAITTITDLAAAASIKVFVASAIPVTALNGQAAAVSLLATATWPSVIPAWAPAGVLSGNPVVATAALTANNTGLVTADIVFADAAGVVDVLRSGSHSAYDAYTVASALLSVQKTVALLCDPVNGATNPMNIPGAAVQYAITIVNTGAAPASLSQISDALAATTAWDATLISGAGAGAACVPAAATTLSATGFGAVSGTGVTTSHVAPGLATQAVTAGATVAGAVGAQTVTVNFPTLASPAVALVGGVLPANQFVTVYFNTFVQ